MRREGRESRPGREAGAVWVPGADEDASAGFDRARLAGGHVHPPAAALDDQRLGPEIVRRYNDRFDLSV
jgi:hypothetical protein